ncbi:ScbR family autoregulator-binding transcription factor [Gordonia sp. (in: high G+C Gram-positive bacteria)]|uniref:ScbR family autoregulator-binding transcription factor n=1 Tax=Gordonia sp. (in: high G+C Gram-positive bacteria) TaxID=84139 RepID=UPI003C77D977
MAQQARALETRRQILITAAHVFRRVGFDRTRLNDIVEESGLTRGAIYFHFKSKDEIADVVVDELAASSLEAVAAVAETGDYAMRQIGMLCREMGRLLIDDPVVSAGIRLVIELKSGKEPIPAYLGWIEALKYLVACGIEQGDVREGVDPEQAAIFIAEAFVGAHVLSYAVTGHEDLAERIDNLADNLIWSLMTAEQVAARPDLLGARLP